MQTSSMMQKHLLLAAGVVVVLTVGACQGPESAPATAPPPAPAQPEYKPTATVRELMNSVIDPAGDVVWFAVQTELTEQGVVETRPETDEDWASVRRGAITLLESANLLMIPGRPVAHPGEKSFAPGIELEPEEIAAMIAEDPNSWNARAIVMHEVSTSVIAAIDARDPDKLFNLGEELDAVCESCHVQYWYPGQFRSLAPSADEPAAEQSAP